MGEVFHGAAHGHFEMPPTRQWLTQQEQVACSIAFIFIIEPFPPSRLGWDGRPLLCHQLLGGLIETDYRTLGIVWFAIKVEDVLHACYKLGAHLGDAPLLLLPWFEFVFPVPAGPSPGR